MIRLHVNGRDEMLETSPATSLLTLLRDELGLLGAKNACEEGECGSCSVWVDGDVVCACLVPAAQLEGRTVRTIEDLAQDATSTASSGRSWTPVPCSAASAHRASSSPSQTSSNESRTPATGRSEKPWPGTSAAAPATQKIIEAVHLAETALP